MLGKLFWKKDLAAIECPELRGLRKWEIVDSMAGSQKIHLKTRHVRKKLERLTVGTTYMQ